MTETDPTSAGGPARAGHPRAVPPPQWDVLGVIAAGGVVGALSRFAVSTKWPHAPAAFPWSTLMVNISGCLLIGVLMTIVLELTEPHRLVRPFLGVGVLGGYTTFSTASVELQRMLDAGRGAPALLYLAASLFGAVAAVWAGTVLARAGERVLSRRPGLGGDPAP